MQWNDIQFDPPRKTLREFAALFLVVFGALGIWEILGKHRPERGWPILAASIVVGSLGLARPRWVRWIYVGWMVLAFPIGWTVSQTILVLVYFGLFTPIGLYFRLVGRDPLERAIDRTRESYWTPKPQPVNPASYFKQF